jgi:hypothetical protein
MAQTHEIIKILFYSPGTGLSTTVSGIPKTLPHSVFGDNERMAHQSKGGKIDLRKDFKQRTLSDPRQIPGYITLVDTASDVQDSTKEMEFTRNGGGTAGHTYQRLIDFVAYAKAVNGKKPSGFIPLYSIYTVIDKPNSTTNLDYLFSNMLKSGYTSDFFDVCVTASKGSTHLVASINTYDMDTNLVLINGGARYVAGQLRKGSKVRAVVLTHAGLDAPLVSASFINNFINGNPTKLFVYSNTQDSHNQASLILGDRSKLHASLQHKTNRRFPHSYLPSLVNAAYYVGRKGKDWSYLIKFFKSDTNVTDLSESLMKGGGSMRNYCGCGSIPYPQTPNSGNNEPNTKLNALMENLYLNLYNVKCECDRIYNKIGGADTNKENDKGKDFDLIAHLYPETGDTPFSDTVSSEDSNLKSDNEVDGDKNSGELNQQGGGDGREYLDIYQGFIGKTVNELIYLKSRSDYLTLKSIA